MAQTQSGKPLIGILALDERIKETFKAIALIVFALIFLFFLYAFRIQIGNAILPWLRLVIDLIETEYQIGEFFIQRSKNEWVFHLRLVTDHPIELFGYKFPRMDASGSTLVTHALLHFFIIPMLAIAGLCYQKIDKIKLFIFTCLALFISLALDIPFTLLGSIEGVLIQSFAPQKLDSNWLVIWERFLTNGGRLAIPIALGLLALICAQKEMSSNLKNTTMLKK